MQQLNVDLVTVIAVADVDVSVKKPIFVANFQLLSEQLLDR